jgi:hypothetical protein
VSSCRLTTTTTTIIIIIINIISGVSSTTIIQTATGAIDLWQASLLFVSSSRYTIATAISIK